MIIRNITYIHVVNEGWTYLASVMNLYDRKIIGWAYSKIITAELATKAVKNACLNILDTTGIVLHSDLGSQYTSEEFEKYLQDQECYIHLAGRGIHMIMPASNPSILY